MSNSFFRYYRPQALIFVIAMLAIAVFYAFESAPISVSAVSAITAFLIVTDKWLWKYRPFAWMFWTKDFSGRYEGMLKYELRNANCEVISNSLKHIKVITQTGSAIEVRSYTFDQNGEPSSQSSSKEVSVSKTEHDRYSLIYTYENGGNAQLQFPPHYGTEIINIVDGGKTKLTGEYYTNRLPFQTRGVFVDLKYKGANLRQVF